MTYEIKPWQLEVITSGGETDEAVRRAVGQEPWASGFGGDRDQSFDFDRRTDARAAEKRVLALGIVGLQTNVWLSKDN